MQFLYSLINLLLIVVIVAVVGRKTIKKIFGSRRDKLNEDLDFAENLSDEEEIPENTETVKLPPLDENAELVTLREKIKQDEIDRVARFNSVSAGMRREELFSVRAKSVKELCARVAKLMGNDPYKSDFRALEPMLVDKILEQIAITPGDMAYLKHKDVLYVTLTSAFPLEQPLVDKIAEKTSKMLHAVGGKPSFWIKVDPSLIGGVCLRIGDTVYDCSVADRLYHLERDLCRRKLDETFKSEDLVSDMMQGIDESEPRVDIYQLGRVISVSDGICWLDGLADIMYGEVVEFECGERGMILDIEPERIGCVIFGRYEHIESTSRVRRVGRMASVPVGEELLGRVVDPLGNAIDGKGTIYTHNRRPIENKAPDIPSRSPVSVPLKTGIKAIDALVPIGRGQRELIIGDRRTGKSAIIIDTIINQKDKNVACIYVAIGQKESTIAEMKSKLEKYGAMEYTTIVAAPASASASMQYIAPFAGAAMSEYFMYGGKDCLIIYDDLSKHAVAYRELSLLLHRPSGREAYPGDVFFLHSRLLERAANLNKEAGGGSVTALPIIETQAGDISAYIPTNVISITDGQIFLDSDLFNEGQRPAVNVGLSVSRVGSAAQSKLIKQISSQLRMDLAQYRELASFAQFGSDLDDSTRETLESGERMMAALRQPRYDPMPEWKQALLIYSVSKGLTKKIKPADTEKYAASLFKHFENNEKDIVKMLETGAKLTPENEKLVVDTVSKFTEAYI